MNINAVAMDIEICKIPKASLKNRELFESMIKKINAGRVILRYEIKCLSDFSGRNPHFWVIKALKDMHVVNIAIDFYLSDPGPETVEGIMDFLHYFRTVKHVSIYFDDDAHEGIYVPTKLLGLYRYHRNMWAQNGYHSVFPLITVLDKNYLGLGQSSMSRHGHSFYKFIELNGNWKIKQVKHINFRFVSLHDQVERLNFYYQIEDDEFPRLFKDLPITKYKRLLKKNNNNIYLTHDYLIEEIHQKIYQNLNSQINN